MNTPPTFAERLQRAFTNPTRGVLGLVDELLAVSREQNLQLAWKEGHCRVGFSGPAGGPPSWIEVPIRKSVVRAALARVAVLCNERNPNSVSPYGGQGEVSVGTDPATVLRVAFANTPDEQTLELVRLPSEGVVDKGGQRKHRAVPTASGIEGEQPVGGDASLGSG
jgi:hypothetical protein